jgi:hypothetical protein
MMYLIAFLLFIIALPALVPLLVIVLRVAVFCFWRGHYCLSAHLYGPRMHKRGYRGCFWVGILCYHRP